MTVPPGPPPPYGPPPYGPPPYQQPPPKTNWWSIAALVFGILGGVLISVVCGIVGLTKARQGQGGRGMAIAGLVLSGLWVLLIVVGVLIFVVMGQGSVDATKVKAGDCLAEIPAGTKVSYVDVVDCARPHKGEVFAVLTMPDGDFPGPQAITQYQNRCEPQLSMRLPAAAADPAIGLFVLYPTEDSWNRGDRAVTCIATSEDARTGNLE